MYNRIKIIFEDEENFKKWEKQLKEVGTPFQGPRYESRGYQCTYVDLRDKYRGDIITLARNLNAKTEKYF